MIYTLTLFINELIILKVWIFGGVVIDWSQLHNRIDNNGLGILVVIWRNLIGGMTEEWLRKRTNFCIRVTYQLADDSVNRLLSEPNLAYFWNFLDWSSMIRLCKNSERWAEVKYKPCKFVQWYSQLIERSANWTTPAEVA